MVDIGIWLGVCLLPFVILVTMTGLGVYIFKHRLIAVILMIGYVALQVYFFATWDLNPLHRMEFWACSLLMVYTLYLGWEMGRKEVVRQTI